MYPNEVELQWSVLIVLYPFITGLVAGAFILASLERVFSSTSGEANISFGPAHGVVVLAGCAFAVAVASGPSGAMV